MICGSFKSSPVGNNNPIMSVEEAELAPSVLEPLLKLYPLPTSERHFQASITTTQYQITDTAA